MPSGSTHPLNTYHTRKR